MEHSSGKGKCMNRFAILLLPSFILAAGTASIAAIQNPVSTEAGPEPDKTKQDFFNSYYSSLK
jgi:hypothetical protein